MRIAPNAVNGGGILARRAFTLAEVLISIGLVAIILGSLINGYLLAAKRAEWNALSNLAQQSVLERAEQIRMARWNTTAIPPFDELVQANFPPLTNALQLYPAETNPIISTNTVVVRLVSTDPPLKSIRCECQWRHRNGRFFTNFIVFYRSPDA
jgi:type II secretory pathway pseudopilin PulG